MPWRPQEGASGAASPGAAYLTLPRGPPGRAGGREGGGGRTVRRNRLSVRREANQVPSEVLEQEPASGRGEVGELPER